MTYAISDLHGCFEKYEKMLEKISFCENDTLYILGDVIDRGNDGIKLLLDISKRKNVVCLCGNHDYTFFVLMTKILTKTEPLEEELKETLKMWISDGGKPTLEAFLSLDKKQTKSILSFISSLPYNKILTVGKNAFHLSHTLPEKEIFLSGNAENEDYLIGEPDYEEVYFENIYMVTGHTPTSFIDPESRGRIWKNNNHIALDCGAVFGNPLGCICLDTFEEFYVE